MHRYIIGRTQASKDWRACLTHQWCQMTLAYCRRGHSFLLAPPAIRICIRIAIALALALSIPRQLPASTARAPPPRKCIFGPSAAWDLVRAEI